MSLQEDRFRVRTNLGINMVVEAGAGTGKTTLLIDRLCFALLAQGIAAPRLVALTFTEKAAAEIKTRLIFKLQAVLRALRNQESESTLDILLEHFRVPRDIIEQRADAALAQLDRSPIGTIHSFCADILRMYPLEAGLTPNAEIDKGPRAQRIFEAEWNRFLDRELGENAPRAVVWKEVLSCVTLNDLYECAREMCSGKMNGYKIGAEADFFVPICQDRAQKATQLAEAFLSGKKKPRVIEQALQQAQRRFEACAKWLTTGALPTEDEPTIEIKSVPKDWDAQSAQEAKALCRFAAQADPRAQQRVQQAIGLLQEVTAAVRARYQAEGILSFDDLLVKTRDLLQTNLWVRRMLQEKYDALYIDEFQDTDPVQGELLLFLAEQKGGGAARWQEVKLEPGKLFVVGDPKQSIYRFRGADITAYELFTDLILQQGGEKAYLRQNFRSEKEIIDLANNVCGAVMQAKPAFQPAYEAIFTQKDETYGAAELALVTENPDALALGYRHNQAEFVAQWIKKQVGQMTLRNGRKVTYGDVCILSRAATTLGPYTEALRRHGITFSIEEDRDFYRRQEVCDFLNWLRVLEDPQDKIALVGIMRSPLGGLTDEEIYQAAQRKELNFYAPSTNAKLERLFEQLRDFAARAGREPLRVLLRQLLQETFLAESCAAAYDGERSIINLQRLVSLAEGYSLQTPSTLGQFLSRIEELMTQEVGRLTALPEGENTGAVKVMTVHKSKGLEFPVVILVDVSKRESTSATSRPVHLYSWKHHMHGLRVGKYADLRFAWLEEEQQEHSRCEEVRVLYVALTRAREKLLVVGNAVPEERTFANMFARAGVFPLSQTQPDKLGQVPVTYIDYQAPEKFIYTHQIAAPSEQLTWDLKAWQRAEEARTQAYEKLMQQAAVLAPSSLVMGAENERAMQLGTLVHEALLRQMRTQDGAEYLRHYGVAADLVQEAQSILDVWLHSTAYTQLMTHQILAAEMPFSLDTQAGVVSGVIDLLTQSADGTLWVIDYKTDQVAAGEEKISAQKYGAQLFVYRQAAGALYPQAVIKTAIALVRRGLLVELTDEAAA